MKTSESIVNISKALFDFEAGAFRKDSTNPFHKNKYVSLDQLLAALWEPLHKNDLLLTHWLTTVENGTEVLSGLATRLIHVPSGEWMESTVPFVGLSSCGSNAAQALGSYTTYARRYSPFAIFNLPGENDDDGNAASSATSPKKGQAEAKPSAPIPKERRADFDADLADAVTREGVAVVHDRWLLDAQADGWDGELKVACRKRVNAL